jgi:hypothetical protein
MKTKFYYSVGNGGDGSAYPQFFETEELAEWDQEFLLEGWGESCVSYFEVEHDGPIKGLGITTAEECLEELLEELSDYRPDKDGNYSGYGKHYKEKLDALNKILK